MDLAHLTPLPNGKRGWFHALPLNPRCELARINGLIIRSMITLTDFQFQQHTLLGAFHFPRSSSYSHYLKSLIRQGSLVDYEVINPAL